jgi:hypothetical protein
MRHGCRTDIRAKIAALSVACVCLAPLVAPCGEPEPSFDEHVRHHLVRAGYLNPLDTLRPFDAPLESDRCRLARRPSNCSCVSKPDRIALSSGFGE